MSMPMLMLMLRCLILIAVMFASACTAQVGRGSPCERENAPAECDVQCDVTADCAAGYYCAAKTCYADCTSNLGCAAGRYCNSHGQCVSGDDIDRPDAMTCPNVSINVAPRTPTVVVVIDQSGSMTAGFGGTSRWQAVRDALVEPTSGIIVQLQSTIIFGAALYTSNNGNAGGQCPMLQEVAPSLNNYPAINTLLATNEPQGDTPTAEAIDQVVIGFPGIDVEEPSPRIIVLATDGNPDNCADADAHNLGSQQMSESAVQRAYSAGIQTVVLSVGDQVAQTHLQKLANAGAGEPLDTGTEQYYVANDPNELVVAVSEAITGVRTCTFSLDQAVDLSQAAQGNVEINGRPLTYGVDWTMSNSTTLVLLGAACDEFKSEPDVELTAEFPCGTIVL